MKEKPIIFSTDMVRAILDGRKTQTRRVVKPQPSDGWEPHSYGDVHKMIDGEFPLKNGDPVVIGWGACNENGDEAYKSPYQPGDILWVRETWCTEKDIADVFPCSDEPFPVGIYYKEDLISNGLEWATNKEVVKWRPSIHMPRSAARIFLRVTDIRVERLQNISEEDVLEEGFGCIYEHRITISETYDSMCWVDGTCNNPDKLCSNGYEITFKNYWDSQNAKRGYGWETNPWVWVYDFERVEDYESTN